METRRPSKYRLTHPSKSPTTSITEKFGKQVTNIDPTNKTSSSRRCRTFPPSCNTNRQYLFQVAKHSNESKRGESASDFWCMLIMFLVKSCPIKLRISPLLSEFPLVIRYVILRNVYGTIARCSSMSSEGNFFSDSPSFRNVAGIHLEAVSQRTWCPFGIKHQDL